MFDVFSYPRVLDVFFIVLAQNIYVERQRMKGSLVKFVQVRVGVCRLNPKTFGQDQFRAKITFYNQTDVPDVSSEHGVKMSGDECFDLTNRWQTVYCQGKSEKRSRGTRTHALSLRRTECTHLQTKPSQSFVTSNKFTRTVCKN